MQTINLSSSKAPAAKFFFNSSNIFSFAEKALISANYKRVYTPAGYFYAKDNSFIAISFCYCADTTADKLSDLVAAIID